MEGKLKGAAIANTRAEHQAAPFTELIRKSGGSSLEVPLIKIRAGESESAEKLKGMLLRLPAYDTVVFTSTNAVYFTLKAMEEAGVDESLIRGVRLACVGTKTERYLNARGLTVTYMPAAFDAEHLAAELVQELPGGSRVLYPRSRIARPVLKNTLSAHGFIVEDPVVYDTVPDPEGARRLAETVKEGRLDVLPFFSPSAVRAFFGPLTACEKEQIWRASRIAAIGPVTGAALKKAGISDFLMAGTYTAEGLIEAITRELYR
ncbi:uroporphyrinogen-III synthase [Alteribacter natronophilus]|uniref:uroporphyrinogen-III synthase n=1 Tax=Alteribacter natronophilus TaxID=2583810 RepID=UPI00110DC52A|nr:uroporphyrinogen-III synthase [Alteribacter natronophilus]TMW71611.1 uroporphyrinogen-III synthase [Alteribacter natronophilus]